MGKYFVAVKISNNGDKLSYKDSSGINSHFTLGAAGNSHFTHGAPASCLMRDFTLEQLYDLVKSKGWELE